MLGSLLLSLGGPLISKLIGAAATAVGGPIVGTIASTVLGSLASGLGASSSSEGDIVTAIQKDLGKAGDLIKGLETTHGPTIEALLEDASNVNLEAAKSSSIFVSGARPAALWVVVAILAYEGLVVPVLSWLVGLGGLAGPPHLLPEVWNGNLQALYGLAGIRMVEAMGGVARDSLASPRAAATGLVAKVVKKMAGK